MSHEEDYSDALVVEQILSGQKDMFRLLLRRYERQVHGMGMSFFRNDDDARDFSQEVFLKVYKNLSGFEGRARFSTWLYKIAYNTALNAASRRKEYSSLAEGPSEIEAGESQAPDRILLRKAAKEAVLESIRDLPERFRLCVDLFFFYERSYIEIEAITGIPVNTIKSHVFRAKKILREKLSEIADGGNL
ncbi:MAG: sigma-70 family RNA polymerase sigma factor [Treponema sp.]|nr:sigma-70 family RNA polymerase sigma factor [Treponema sp.]